MDDRYNSRGTPPPAYARAPSRNMMKVAKCPNEELALANYLIVAPGDFDPHTRYVILNDNFVFTIRPLDKFLSRSIGTSALHRRWAYLSLNDDVKVESYDPFADGLDIYAVRMELEVGFLTKQSQSQDEFNTEEMGRLFTTILSQGQPLAFEFKGYKLSITIKSIDVVNLDAIRNGLTEMYDSRSPPPGSRSAMRGVLMQETSVNFSKAPDSPIRLIGASRVSNAPRLVPLDFKFEDMGIGGLDREFSTIFRRAFASRIFDPRIVEKLGIQHVKGILLYGPPGTGKTLIARQIGKMLNATEPKIVNGPEILNKYVGESEASIRKLFADAEKDYKQKAEDSPLHIIIFDELDAVCKQRGSKNDGTGVGDTIVNQLLAKLDGVDQLNNVLLIGMTNRKDMIDEALLRPGRLEVHMEIGLPDEHGRLQILKIHTAKSRENKILSSDVDLIDLARRTKNFSGAEIAGLVKSASSFALQRHVKVGTVAIVDESVKDIQITQQDFVNALEEVQPAFGVSEEELTACVANGIIPFAPHIDKILNDGRLFVSQVNNSERTSNLSILFHGPAGSGKTALAARIALDSGAPYIKLITSESMIGMSETLRVSAIAKVFQDSYKSPFSVIVVDAIERLIDWVSVGPRFSNGVLQALLVLLKKKPPLGRRLLVLATANSLNILKELEFNEAFNSNIYIPNISDIKSVDNVLKPSAFSSGEQAQIIQRLSIGPDERISVGVKKLQSVIEMALQDANKVEKFCSELTSLDNFYPLQDNMSYNKTLY